MFVVAERARAEKESIAIRGFLFFKNEGPYSSKIDVRGSEALRFQDAYE